LLLLQSLLLLLLHPRLLLLLEHPQWLGQLLQLMLYQLLLAPLFAQPQHPLLLLYLPQWLLHLKSSWQQLLHQRRLFLQLLSRWHLPLLSQPLHHELPDMMHHNLVLQVSDQTQEC
jgi:hypothetical protein